MYEFATVLLLGLALAKVMELVGDSADVSRSVRGALTIGLGIAITAIADYSVFGAWGVAFRSEWMGPFFTGLSIAGLAGAWRAVVDLLRSYARRSYDQATEIESRTPRRVA